MEFFSHATQMFSESATFRLSIVCGLSLWVMQMVQDFHITSTQLADASILAECSICRRTFDSLQLCR